MKGLFNFSVIVWRGNYINFGPQQWHHAFAAARFAVMRKCLSELNEKRLLLLFIFSVLAKTSKSLRV